MHPDLSALIHTPERQNSLATMSKAIEQLPHQLSICRGINVAKFFKKTKKCAKSKIMNCNYYECMTLYTHCALIKCPK